MTAEKEQQHLGRLAGFRLGCLVAMVLGVVLLTLGFEVFGKLCLLVAASSELVRARRDQSYRWIFSRRLLERQTHPLQFWSLLGLDAVLTLAALWILIDAVQEALR